MKTLKDRRKAAAFVNTQPTKTDQSAASQTDLNVIVNQFLKTGTTSSRGNPRYGDFSELPQDLRGMIEQARSVQRLRRGLPDALREKPIEELLTLTPDQLTSILTPPKPETNNGTPTTKGNERTT